LRQVAHKKAAVAIARDLAGEVLDKAYQRGMTPGAIA
jgi:hypothetical protein